MLSHYGPCLGSCFPLTQSIPMSAGGNHMQFYWKFFISESAGENQSAVSVRIVCCLEDKNRRHFFT